MQKHTNKLIKETSPYLLQHAHNPVNWYPWGDEALEKAEKENKPILVSIGYAACHWCHVMERESFEDETTAALMNENFVNIKIDREERPDLDHIYMDAVQAMTGSGGWPLNIFLTPDKKPFYGGTYFPPQRAYNRPSWTETLTGVIQAFKERRHEIDAQAENLTEHLVKSNNFGINDNVSDEVFTNENLATAFANVMKSADTEWGGFGKAPKFPQTFTIQFLLRYYHISKSEEALQQALLSLDKMIEGGIYDQLGGGFARYSTDTEWLTPHFEKMLYDNALLISLLSEAFQLTQRSRYREVIEETMEFIQREMLDVSNGFYAALDADSEGIEGKFYVWDFVEVKEALGDDAVVFCQYYDVSEQGNWEHKNILRVRVPLEKFANENNLSVSELNRIIGDGKEKLMKIRNKRIRPLLDDKIILGWNALMNTACSKAFAATGNKSYRQLAIDNMNFLLNAFTSNDGYAFSHTWKNGEAKFPAFLDDYAFLIEALIHLQEITTDTKWLSKAKELANHVIRNFSEDISELPESYVSTGGYFFYTPVGQTDVIVRKKEMYDGAVPSGNSVMAYNLWKLALYFDERGWQERSAAMCSSLFNAITKYPTSFGYWASMMLEITSGTSEIAIIGDEASAIHKDLLQKYIPQKLLMVSINGGEDFPLIKNKQVLEKTAIYLCSNYTCLSPVFSVEDLISLINRPSKL